MKLYNTYTQQIDELKPIEPGKVSMYVCGPTVYNYPHIGNARPIAVFDTLKKALEAQGLDVTYVSNFTDVDDKIINKAIEEGTTEKEVAERYIEAYNDVRTAMNADIPDFTPRVTQTMDHIISFIGELEKKGAAYPVDGDVYFSIKSDPKYGELSHQNIEDLEVGARIEENSKKKDPLDFALWKTTDKGIQWDSPWSKGRPGWHTECVVMIRDVFGRDKIDIHGGGMDLKFPHHENEVAQNEALSGNPLANLWVHNGMVNIEGNKMSKSLGNVIWAKDLLDLYGGNTVRWMMNSAHYRAPLNMNEEAFESAKKELGKIQSAYNKAAVKLQLENAPETSEIDNESFGSFIAALNDDLNTPNAISAVYETLKKLNGSIRKREINLEEVGALKNTLQKEMHIVGVELEELVLSEQDREDYAAWRAAVKAKDFESADKYRARLMEKGIV